MRKAIILFLSILSNVCIGQNENLDHYFNEIERDKLGIGAIAIAKNGQPFYKKDFGYNQNDHIKLYRIGSISKMFTAILVEYFADQGSLNIENKLSSYFPLIPNADKITINNLLNHTSGLKDYVVKNDSLIYWLTEPVEDLDIMNEIIRQGVIFEPDRSQRYSNSGYYLLRKILEKISSNTYPELVDKFIVNPLKLGSTISGIESLDEIIQPKVINTRGEWETAIDFYFQNVIGVGDVVSNPDDLIKLITSVFSGEIISIEAVNRMKPAKKDKFGAGIMAFTYGDKFFYGHGGDTYVSHSVILYNPSDSISIALCINGQALKLTKMISDVVGLLYDSDYKYTLPSPLSNVSGFDVGEISKYVGCYVSNNSPIKLKVYLNGGNLMAQASGQLPFILEYVNEDKFRNTTNNINFDFDPKQDSLLVIQNGVVISMSKSMRM